MFIYIIHLLSILLVLTIYPSWFGRFVLFVILGKCLESILNLKGFGGHENTLLCKKPLFEAWKLWYAYFTHINVISVMAAISIIIYDTPMLYCVYYQYFYIPITNKNMKGYILGTTCILQVFDLSEKNSFWFQLKLDFAFLIALLLMSITSFEKTMATSWLLVNYFNC